ncbi:MAG: ParB/Srx family N-terminal domain-containing protein [Lachnospiraceae bacterium]|nr:ParB/Srx family N-terminal domain-containing protein [Lachnospiraceae bacterium]
MDEPVIVQKIRPHGYMLLNGHHRWAAALRIGIKKIPVSIVNSVFESDIREMLERSVNEKRATLDLDEVVFRKDGDSDTEKAPSLFRFGIHRKKMRLGIPVLFRYLKKNGCDIWVYSADFYSIDDIRSYFKRYGVTVDGIITGTKKKRKDGKSEYEGVENLITGKYKETIHIDNDMVLITHSQSKDFEDVHIDCESGQWASSIIEAVENSGKA